MNRIQVTIELQRPSRPAGLQSSDNRGGLGPVGLGTLDREAIGLNDLRQPIGDRSGAARGAGHLDEGHRCFNKTLCIDRGKYGVGKFLRNHR